MFLHICKVTTIMIHFVCRSRSLITSLLNLMHLIINLSNFTRNFLQGSYNIVCMKAHFFKGFKSRLTRGICIFYSLNDCIYYFRNLSCIFRSFFCERADFFSNNTKAFSSLARMSRFNCRIH